MMIRVMPCGCVTEVYHVLFLFVYLNKLKRQCDSEILANLVFYQYLNSPVMECQTLEYMIHLKLRGEIQMVLLRYHVFQ